MKQQYSQQKKKKTNETIKGCSISIKQIPNYLKQTIPKLNQLINQIVLLWFWFPLSTTAHVPKSMFILKTYSSSNQTPKKYKLSKTQFLKQKKLKIWKKNLELLNKENRRRMRLKRIIELESSIEEANGSIIKTSYHFTPSTRTTLDFPLLLFLFHVVVILFFFFWNCAFCNVLLLEEFELPPLIHRRRDSQSIDRNRNRNSNQKCEGFFKLSRELNLQRDRSRCDEWRSHSKKLPAAKRQFRPCLQMPFFLACSLKLIS